MTTETELSPERAITLLVGAFFCWQRDEALEAFWARGGYTNGMGMTGFHVIPREDEWGEGR